MFHVKQLFGGGATGGARPFSLLLCLLAGLALSPLYAQNDQELYVQRVEEDGHLLVPMRAIFEALGWEVEWRGDNQRIYAYQGDQTLAMWVDSREAVLNGQQVQLEVPPRLLGDATQVPLRFVSEATGRSVEYLGGSVRICDCGNGGGALTVHLIDD